MRKYQEGREELAMMVVNSNVKDLAVLPPLKLAFYTFIICEQTTL